MVFAAPAGVTIGAAAAPAVGTVTNVEIFANLVSLGSTHSAQFSVTTNLAVGQYALTAVETGQAASSITSLVANISVRDTGWKQSCLFVTRITGSQFAFDYTANPGLQYVVQYSTNLYEAGSLWSQISIPTIIRCI